MIKSEKVRELRNLRSLQCCLKSKAHYESIKDTVQLSCCHKPVWISFFLVTEKEKFLRTVQWNVNKSAKALKYFKIFFCALWHLIIACVKIRLRFQRIIWFGSRNHFEWFIYKSVWSDSQLPDSVNWLTARWQIRLSMDLRQGSTLFDFWQERIQSC